MTTVQCGGEKSCSESNIVDWIGFGRREFVNIESLTKVGSVKVCSEFDY